MADAAIALDDVRHALATGTISAVADSGDRVAGILACWDDTLRKAGGKLRRQRTAVQLMERNWRWE